jgi:hypothetical protein
LVAPRKKKAEIPKIDRDKLRAKLRCMGDEYVFYMLDDAIDVLSDAQLSLGDDALGDVVEVRPEHLAKLLVLGPQCLVDEPPGDPRHDG